MTAVAEVRVLVKRFGETTAVDGVDLAVSRGEVVGLLGANGAGKTTVIRCLLGLLAPTAGTVAVLGGAPDRKRLRRVGYLPQGLGLYPDLTVAENLAFRRAIFGGEIAPLDAELIAYATDPVGALPLGLQRRAAFAGLLGHRPELLVLDEPTSGVGPLARARLWDTIRSAAERGAAVLVTTHHLEEAEQCDRLVMLAAGRVVASGSLAEVIAGRTAVEVTGPIPELLAALDAAGLIAAPAAGQVRVSGAAPETVRSAVAGVATGATVVPASLEEAFVSLARS